MKKIYWTYRHKWTNTWVRYTPSYFLDKQFSDFLEAGLTKTLDNEISENRYTSEIVPWIKKQTRFLIWEYNEKYIKAEDLSKSITNVWAEFNIKIFNTTIEAIDWIKKNTDLVEKTPWTFIIREEHINKISWETIPTEYLIID